MPELSGRPLIARLEHDAADSCTMLVIASGDHAFAASAIAHRGQGRRVQVIARTGSIAAALYRVVDDFIHVDATCIAGDCDLTNLSARSEVA